MAPPKTLIFIIGPQAVGKMTEGQELSRARCVPIEVDPRDRLARYTPS